MYITTSLSLYFIFNILSSLSQMLIIIGNNASFKILVGKLSKALMQPDNIAKDLIKSYLSTYSIISVLILYNKLTAI